MCELYHAPGVAPVGPHASTFMGEWQLQSDVVVPASAPGGTTTTHQTVTFSDMSVGHVAGLDITTAPESSLDQTENIDFVKFLSRPVRIASFTWAESDAVGTSRTYNPWQLYFTDSRVQYKLNNFSFVQCKLKVKVLINASPFYYGRMYMGYQPLPTLTPSTIVNDTGTRYFIPYSQRPHIWLDPMDNAGGEMTLPFFYQQNWINAQSSSAMLDQGQLTFLNYTTLASANGVSAAGVTVSIYAWAEDVKLSGPSVGLATQSLVLTPQVQADEYGEGAVSGPASAVARAASYFENVPIIGRFATATRMGASAVSSIASLFGWTNVPVVDDARPFRPEPFPQLASTQIGYPVQKLTLDPKNELTVDPQVTGLDAKDELIIADLCQKQSYLTTATWSTTNLVDDILFSSIVNPRMFDTDGLTNSKIYMTPLCWVSSMFSNWRGDIVFNFKVVASQYHKGRLRISFDPSGYAAKNLLNDVNTSNVVFTSIVDLGESNEVEFAVPYQQAISYLAMRSSNFVSANIPFSTGLSPTFAYNPLYDNGTISVRVLTALTAPVLTSSVSILVSVRSGSNIEFANPVEMPTYTNWAPQSDTIAPASDVLGTAQNKHCNQANLVNFGETVKSLRQLLRRSSLVSVSTPASNTADVVLWRKNFTKIPGMYGFDPAGINTAKGLVVPATTFNYNFSQTLPITWIMPAFVAYRGSTHWTFNTTSGATPAEHIRVQRLNAGTNSVAEGLVTWTRGTVSENARNFYRLAAGSTGCALTNARTSAGISVGTPMYTAFRFQSTAPKYYTSPTSADGSILDMYQLEVLLNGSGSPTTASTAVFAYHAIGTDFGLHFFLNVPTYWSYSAVPTPV